MLPLSGQQMEKVEEMLQKCKWVDALGRQRGKSASPKEWASVQGRREGEGTVPTQHLCENVDELGQTSEPRFMPISTKKILIVNFKNERDLDCPCLSLFSSFIAFTYRMYI